MRRIVVFNAFVALFWFLGAGTATAMQVEPVFIEMSTSNPSASIRVTNTDPTQMTIQVSVTRRTTNLSGEETTQEADGDFVVFPPQAVIQPGETQTFALQWAGGPIAQSQSYHIGLEQLPVDFSAIAEGGSGIQIVFSFNASVHVAPPGAEPALQVIEQGPGTTEDGRAGHRFVVQNTGTRYAYISDYSLLVDGGTSYSGQELTQLIGNTLITPGARRQFVLPLSASSVSVAPAQ